MTAVKIDIDFFGVSMYDSLEKRVNIIYKE